MLVAVLHLFPDEQNPRGIVSTLVSALPPGSYLVASQTTSDFHDEATAAEGVEVMQQAGVPFQARTAADFADLALTGLDLVAPGLVPVSEWRPETEPGLIPLPWEVGYLGAVARKPVRPREMRQQGKSPFRS